MKAILDAGPMIALWGRGDGHKEKHQEWARGAFRQYRGPFLTTEAVLCEIGFMTGRAEEILEGVARRHFIIGLSFEQDAAAMARVLRDFQHCDLADSSI